MATRLGLAARPLPLELQLKALDYAIWASRESQSLISARCRYPVTSSLLRHPLSRMMEPGHVHAHAAELLRYRQVSVDWRQYIQEMQRDIAFLDGVGLSMTEFWQSAEVERKNRARVLEIADSPASSVLPHEALVGTGDFWDAQEEALLQKDGLKSVRAAVLGYGQHRRLNYSSVLNGGLCMRLQALACHLNQKDHDGDLTEHLAELLSKCTRLKELEIWSSFYDMASDGTTFGQPTSLFKAIRGMWQLESLMMRAAYFEEEASPAGVYALSWDRCTITTLVLDKVFTLVSFDSAIWLLSQISSKIVHADLSLGRAQDVVLKSPPSPQLDTTWPVLQHLRLAGPARPPSIDEGPPSVYDTSLDDLVSTAPALKSLCFDASTNASGLLEVILHRLLLSPLPFKELECRLNPATEEQTAWIRKVQAALVKRAISCRFRV